MAVLRESPWYEQILSEGEARGMTKGQLKSIASVLLTKCGAPGLELMSQITPITNEEQIDMIIPKIILSNSLEEIRQFIQELRKQSSNS